MIEVALIYSTPDGPREIDVTRSKVALGRGDVDHRFDDEGLSRSNSIVYRDGDKVWIVDDNSTNGTFVNGMPTGPAGTPLRNGDVIKIGNRTSLKVRVSDKNANLSAASATASPVSTPTSAGAVTPPSSGSSSPISLVPIALIAIALFVISVSGLFIGIKVFGIGQTEVAEVNTDEDGPDDQPEKTPKPSPSPTKDSRTNSVNNSESGSLGNSNSPTPTISSTPAPSGKKYMEMADGEKRQYIDQKAREVASYIGNNDSEPLPANAVDAIKRFLDSYVSRLKVTKALGCESRNPFGDSLITAYERASKNARFIIRSFNKQIVDPRIGLYLAMIESEHCTCLQSPTGPLGLFQFTFATAQLHFADKNAVVKGAKPPVGDVRCQPEPAADAAASYMRDLKGRFGSGTLSVPLAIGSYNSGEGGLSNNLKKTMAEKPGTSRDFWTLIANSENLSKQFQMENFKYVPKFFAAAIIGENPRDFGLSLNAISSYTN